MDSDSELPDITVRGNANLSDEEEDDPLLQLAIQASREGANGAGETSGEGMSIEEPIRYVYS